MHISIDGHGFTVGKAEIVLFILLMLVAIIFLLDWRQRKTCDPNIITLAELNKIQKEYLMYTEHDSKVLNTKLLKAVYGSACRS